jgi:murein hydrolase activator
MRAVAALLALAIGASAAHAAGGPLQAARAAAERIAATEAELVAAGTGEGRYEAVVKAVGSYEEALVTLGRGHREADNRAEAIAVDLAVRRDAIARLLAALQKIERNRNAAGGLHPDGPLGAARASAMLEAMRPALEEEVGTLKRALADLAAARDLRERGVDQIADGLRALEAAREELATLLAARRVAEVADGDAASAAALAAMMRDSDTLTSFAAALDGAPVAVSSRQAPLPPRPWPLPVAGEVLRGFEAPDAAGVRRPGIVVAAPPRALVTAPVAATVRYAGPFLDYGWVVVLEPVPGTLAVLAGLGAVHVATGAPVEAGALLGQMGGRALSAEEFLMLSDTGGGGAGAPETLYIEVRRGDGPVDPSAWFVAGAR